MKFAWRSFFLLALVLFFFGCEKDLPIPNETRFEVLPSSQTPHSGFVKYEWSEKEAQFFNLTPPSILEPKPGSADEKTGLENGVIYHPLVIDGYNEIAEQNNREHFIEVIVNEMGVPYWQKAIVYDNGDPNSQLALVPFLSTEPDKFSGVLSIKREAGNIVINGMSRKNLLRTEEGNPKQRSIYAEWMYSYQSWLLSTEEDEELRRAYCLYNERLGASNEWTNPPTGYDCEWRIVELCSDLNSQTSWIGGRDNIPPHLDHDRDGILNEDDQDWLEFSRRFGITQEEWENLVTDWWIQHQEGVHGYYQSYYEDYDGYWDDIFQDFWDSYEDWIREYDDDHNIFDDPYEGWPPYAGGGTGWGPNQDDYPDDYPEDCWGGNLNSSGGGRDIRCDFVYLLFCSSEEEGSWWDYNNMIVCHSCIDEQNADYEFYFFQQKFVAFINEHNLHNYSSYLEDLLNPGDCPSQVDEQITFSCFASVLMDAFLEDNQSVILNPEERNWLQSHPGVLGELLVVSEANGQGQISQAYIDQFIRVASNLQLDDENARWLLYENQVLQTINTFLEENENDPNLQDAATFSGRLAITITRQNRIFGPYDEDYFNTIENNFTEAEIAENPWLASTENLGEFMHWGASIQAAFQQRDNNEWPDWPPLKKLLESWKENYSEKVHLGLDLIGLVPVLGEVADLTNGLIYSLEGDGINAVLSLGAAIPFAGWFFTGAKYAEKVITGYSGYRYTLKFIVDEATDLIKFGDRAQLRRAIQSPPGHQAHHMIPWDMNDNPLIQKAAKGSHDVVYHPNHVNNGISLPLSRHSGPHDDYSNWIESRLNDWNLANPDATPDEAATALTQWQQRLWNQISDSVEHINDIVPPPITP